MKKIYLLIAAAIITASCSDNKETKTTPSDTFPPPPASPPSTDENVKVPDEVTLSKKDTGKTEKIIFLVKNITEPAIDRSGYSVTKPEDNEKYISVQVWIKNVSNEEIKVFEDEFKLSDQTDAEFVEKDGFTEHRKKPILFDDYPTGVTLKPNQSKSGWITFTTDKESTAKKILYSNVTINL